MSTQNKGISKVFSEKIPHCFLFNFNVFIGDDFELIQQEIAMMQHCQHPNIIQYMGSYLRYDTCCVKFGIWRRPIKISSN